jgi:hypothetical protein
MIELSAINTTSAPASPEDATMVPAQEFLLQPNIQ